MTIQPAETDTMEDPMSTTQCTDKHTYTITGPAGETLAATEAGPKLAWVLWTNAGAQALDMTATHPDGAACPAETRSVRNLLPGGPYETRRQARIEGRPLLDAVHASGPGSPAADVAADYVAERLARLGVQLGAFDEQIAAWVSGWEPEVVAPILGWVQRAREAGRDAAAGQ